jgi:uncharacterized protein (TIGR02246 family)
MSDHDVLKAVYHDLLAAWNRRSGEDFAAQFVEDGEVVGFDGSETKGRAIIAAEMQRIFMDHQTGEYIGKVRQVHLVTPEVALVMAVAGVVPAGQSDVNPALNSVQSLVLKKGSERWQILLYQNTPAQFHGRPELVEKLTEELRQERRRPNKKEPGS